MMRLSINATACLGMDAPSRTAGVESGTLPDYGMNRVLCLLGLSILIKYLDRSNLSIAAAVIKDELNSTGAQLGALLAGFFDPYTFAADSGWLARRLL